MDPPQRISHESIYSAIYAMPIGELRKEVIALLRKHHKGRRLRTAGRDRRKLIKGASNRSQVGTLAQPDAAARTVAENADMVLGVKVRMSENVIARHGLEPLKRAIAACERSGVPAKVQRALATKSSPMTCLRGCQRCGSSSSMRLALCVGSRVRTSFRYLWRSCPFMRAD